MACRQRPDVQLSVFASGQGPWNCFDQELDWNLQGNETVPPFLATTGFPIPTRPDLLVVTLANLGTARKADLLRAFRERELALPGKVNVPNLRKKLQGVLQAELYAARQAVAQEEATPVVLEDPAPIAATDADN